LIAHKLIEFRLLWHDSLLIYGVSVGGINTLVA